MTLVEALLAGTISDFLFYPVFNSSKIKDRQLKGLVTGLFLYVGVGTIIKLLMIVLASIIN